MSRLISWDEPKRHKNLAKHGIDFADCATVFDQPMATREDARENYGEMRLQSIGQLGGHIVFLVWVDRPSGPHLISCRKAERHERKIYAQALGY
ncbi:MAG: BrnT family toxin [Proteobacteria bacterium]|nr:BrnT family toxin [Pseudomonadota bacterium]